MGYDSLLCVTLLGCSGRMLGWFLPAALGVGWKVLWGTAGALLLGLTGLEWSGYTAGVCFGLYLSDAARKLGYLC